MSSPTRHSGAPGARAGQAPNGETARDPAPSARRNSSRPPSVEPQSIAWWDLKESQKLDAGVQLRAIVEIAIALHSAAEGAKRGDAAPAAHGALVDTRGRAELLPIALGIEMVGDEERVLAPEVRRGAAPDSRANIFCLGALLAEAVTGEPFVSGQQLRDQIDERRGDDQSSKAWERELLDLAARATLAQAAARGPQPRVLASEILRVGGVTVASCEALGELVEKAFEASGRPPRRSSSAPESAPSDRPRPDGRYRTTPPPGNDTATVAKTPSTTPPRAASDSGRPSPSRTAKQLTSRVPTDRGSAIPPEVQAAVSLLYVSSTPGGDSTPVRARNIPSRVPTQRTSKPPSAAPVAPSRSPRSLSSRVPTQRTSKPPSAAPPTPRPRSSTSSREKSSQVPTAVGLAPVRFDIPREPKAPNLDTPGSGSRDTSGASVESGVQQGATRTPSRVPTPLGIGAVRGGFTTPVVSGAAKSASTASTVPAPVVEVTGTPASPSPASTSSAPKADSEARTTSAPAPTARALDTVPSTDPTDRAKSEAGVVVVKASSSPSDSELDEFEREGDDSASQSARASQVAPAARRNQRLILTAVGGCFLLVIGVLMLLREPGKSSTDPEAPKPAASPKTQPAFRATQGADEDFEHDSKPTPSAEPSAEARESEPTEPPEQAETAADETSNQAAVTSKKAEKPAAPARQPAALPVRRPPAVVQPSAPVEAPEPAPVDDLDLPPPPLATAVTGDDLKTPPRAGPKPPPPKPAEGDSPPPPVPPAPGRSVPSDYGI